MPQMDSLLQSVADFIKSHGLDGSNALPARWVVALSGGVDSTVLLYVLHQLAQRHNATLEAVHVEHGLRADSQGDRDFVEGICLAWGVQVQTREVRVSDIPKADRRGTEADARTLRYEAIASVVADSAGRSIVFLGHHADDQVETVLLRLLRGSSLTGMAGMRPVREWHGVRWVRPLLTQEKKLLIEFADVHKISYVEDRTNQELDYSRNFVRHAVLPQLRQLQPNLTRVVERSTTVWEAEDAWLESCSRALFQDCAVKVPFGWRVDCAMLQSAALPLQRRVVKIILYCLASVDWTFDHVESILRLCAHSAPSSEIHLPKGIRAERIYHTVQVVHRSRVEPTQYERTWVPLKETTIDIPLEHASETWQFTAISQEQGNGMCAMQLTTQFEAVFPQTMHFTLRPARQGERMQLLGSKGSKKVQDIFVDGKIPRHLRVTWPGLFIGSELVWVPGLARSRLHCVTGQEVFWYHVTASRKSNISC